MIASHGPVPQRSFTGQPLAAPVSLCEWIATQRRIHPHMSRS
ncbi:protein of unknown function [Streptomyces sp. KY75]|nr:protein of unknown function [Streptomyces sp. KY75]CAD5984303.1 protein of unknown function [Streptomyces sp. KY70]